MARGLEVKFRFTEGDTDAIRRYVIKEDGAAKNLTGFSAVKLHATRQDGTDIAAITGSIVSPATAGLVDVNHITMCAVAGRYYCELRSTSALGDIACEEAFINPVRKRASAMDT